MKEKGVWWTNTDLATLQSVIAKANLRELTEAIADLVDAARESPVSVAREWATEYLDHRIWVARNHPPPDRAAREG